MKTISSIKSLVLILFLVLSATLGKAAPLGTDFIYQGSLSVTGSPASGAYDMKFTLYHPGETTPGPSVTIDGVPVSRGLFTVRLDFGAGVFGDTAYELDVAVRQPGSQFTSLVPRQLLAATPNALHAKTVSSVPDTALSQNVALLDAGPAFSDGITANVIQVHDATGGGIVLFGSSLCSIGVDPQGPAGLLLRDPRGIRILSPDPTSPPRLLFGPTDDCSIGIDPVLPGLILRDPRGFRIAPTDPMAAPRLLFGPTDDCTIGIDPAVSGLLLRDPRGIRILPTDPTALPTLRFGPTDDCSIGIDPAFPGLVERDPIGFRLMGRNNQGCRLIFGPTMDCTVEVDPTGPQGLLLRDPKGIRILPPAGNALPSLRFGPTDDCSIGIDPAFPGLVERDPIGFRLLGRNNDGGRLIFGPTMDCTIEVQAPNTSNSVAGLLLRDPKGIRIFPPAPTDLPMLRFGPTDDCSIGIDPAFPGLVERDPIGFRLMGRNNQGCRLIFGPTMDCTVEVDPGGPQGLLLRDPSGIRVLSSDPVRPPRLLFGPTDDCSIGIDPALPGLVLRDPRGLRIAPTDPTALPTLRFGPTDDCSIGIDPAFPGLVERDPIGFRLLGRNNDGGRLIFGPTMDCTIEVQPPNMAGSIPGLLLRDPAGIRILSPDAQRPPTLRFGPTDDCSIGIDPAFPGLVERDPIGFRLMGRNNQGCRLIFGPTMDCTVEVDPGGPQGLLLRDPSGIRVLPRGPNALPTLRFGPTDDCSIGIDPAFPGLVERDPIGFRLLGRNNEGCRLIFGPTMDCTIEVQPPGSNNIAGLLLRDPNGIRVLSPDAERPPTLRFGPTDDCSIGIDPVLPGLVLRDPSGLRIAPAGPAPLPRLLFGPTDDCSIGIDPAFPGLVERDPIGFRLMGRNNQGGRLIFGPTMDCTVEVDPAGPQGLLLRDPNGIRILPRSPNGLPTLRFGPTDDCSIGIDPVLSGLILRDPRGFRIAPNDTKASSRLIFGLTDDCSIGIDPGGVPGALTGLLLRDPAGIRILSTDPQRPPTLRFGPLDDCNIGINPNGGIRFNNPQGFAFNNQVTVNGPVFAQTFVQTSSRRFKENVKPIEEPLEKISKLKGVRFTWKEEKGGRPDIGFIAEEVSQVIPEVVAWEEDGQNARGVNYDHLVAVAIEGIKAQQTQIETLEREKAELKQSLDAMQSKLDRLSQQFEKIMARQ